MILYNYKDKQDTKITFLTTCFCTVMEINRNAGKEECFNSEFSCI